HHHLRVTYHASIFYIVCSALLHILPYITHFPLFFFNDPAPTETYTLSLHDALPILLGRNQAHGTVGEPVRHPHLRHRDHEFPCIDRKSTRLNSSHVAISYAVFCLKKKKKKKMTKLAVRL